MIPSLLQPTLTPFPYSESPWPPIHTSVIPPTACAKNQQWIVKPGADLSSPEVLLLAQKLLSIET
jgi:hypothetical protein